MSALGRLKRAVRAAISECGGIDGAQATVERVGRTQVGNWNALNHPDLPMLHDAVAIDEIAVADGKRPEIVSALARELGGVFLPLPRVESGETSLAMGVCELAKELGEVSAKVSDALADGKVDPREAADVEHEVNDLIERAVSLRAELQRLQGGGVVSIPVHDRSVN